MKIDKDYTEDKYWFTGEFNQYGDEEINTDMIADELAQEIFITSDLMGTELVEVLIKTLKTYCDRYGKDVFIDDIDLHELTQKLFKRIIGESK